MHVIFQFHKGTIKTLYKLFHIVSMQNFNSIKVQLNHVVGFGFLLSAVFQFHKGTIKPYEAVANLLAAITFQFHKGTIKPSVLYSTHLVSMISIP